MKNAAKLLLELAEKAAAEHRDEEVRWKWVLFELSKVATLDSSVAIRFEEPDGREQLIAHLAWLTRKGPTCIELDCDPAKAMRWAAWAQGAMVVLGLITLAECKRLNMRATWEALKAS